MNKVIRRIVMAAIVVGLLSGMCLVAEAATTEGINYKDATGNTESCTVYTLVSSGTSWDGGWYAVTDDTSISDTITIQGSVNLILCDGATLTMKNIVIKYGSLNIYEGSTADSILGSGAMLLYAPRANAIYQEGGSLNIYGGRINATSGNQSAIRASGNGAFTINGGFVRATGRALGILCDGASPSLEITGGIVIATGGGDWRGIQCTSGISVKEGLLKYESDDGSSWSTIGTLGEYTKRYAVIGEGAVQVNSGSKYPTLDIALQNCTTSTGDIITLLRDVYTFDTTTIPADKSITLDLNDYGIMYTEGGNASVLNIMDGGVLILKDDSSTKTDRYITLKDGRGAAVSFNESAESIAVRGGYITGGTGTVDGDHTYGGGVNNAGKFFMLGGTIAGNTADYGGGVYTSTPSDFQIENTPEIRDNALSNVYLPENKTITVAGPLENEKPIGVTMQTPGQFTVNGDYAVEVSDYKDRFVSDDSDYIVSILNDPAGDQLQLLLKNPPKPPEPTPAKVSGTPVTKMTSGKTSMTLAWEKTEGVDGYDIFFSRCNHGSKKVALKNVKTISGNNTFVWKNSGLKKGTCYKAYVKAYIMTSSGKKYVKSSPLMHAYTGKGTKKYTNAKSVKVNKKNVSVKVGKTFKIKAKVRKLKKNKKLMPKKHVQTVRYLSTDTSIATVSKKGKIKGVKAGTCYVYAYAHNGVFKKVKVTVK